MPELGIGWLAQKCARTSVDSRIPYPLGHTHTHIHARINHCLLVDSIKQLPMRQPAHAARQSMHTETHNSAQKQRME
eukprot:2994825-Pleurochrysis_carterae.AAC.2